MALKHIMEYYNQVCDDYREAIDTIKDFEKEVQQGIVEPERIDLLKQNLQPLLTNYEQISYIIFLLNKPAKKEKEKKYLNQNKKVLSKIKKENTSESLLLENKEVIKRLKLL